MALADYSTAVEKIAALKCAMMDPALSYIAVSNFTTNDVIFVIVGGRFTVDGNPMYPEEAYGYNLRIANGSNITGLTGIAKAFIYIKDGDIVYNNPIDLYQNRLAQIIETDKTFITNGGSFTAGTYGSVIAYGYNMRLDTGELINTGSDTNTGNIVPIPAGQQIATDTYIYSSAAYFDVPSGW